MILSKLVTTVLLVEWVVALPDLVQFQAVLNTLPDSQTGRVSSINYNADGSKMLTLSGGTITIWSRSPSGQYTTLQTINQDGALETAQLSTDGSKIAAGGAQSKTYVWNLNPSTGRYEQQQVLVRADDSTSNKISSISFTDDGSKLISGSSDGSVNVWAIAPEKNSYNFLQKLTGGSSGVKQLATHN